MLSILKNPKVIFPVLLLALAVAADYHFRSSVSAAYEAGFSDAQQEARINDTLRASEVRRKAAEAGFSLGTSIPRPADQRMLGTPDPSDTRGYRD